MLQEQSTVVIAPDSFKGSADANEIAISLAAGWASVRPEDRVVLAPMADGGEGTLDAFRAAIPDAKAHHVDVLGPAGSTVRAPWLMLPDKSAVVELASTSGVGLAPEPIPLDAHTYGFGQAVADAIRAGATRLFLALGGSASTDGGVGALRALGAEFFDADGRPVPLGGRGLPLMSCADFSGLPVRPARGVHVLSDVRNPLLGSAGAAAVFGPQKGATPADVQFLEEGLSNLLHVVGEPDAPGGGAAGGTGYGLRAWGAELRSGASAIGDILDLPALVRDADVVITGEGRYDGQSSAGKVPDYVSGIARDAGTLALLAAGSITADPQGYAIALELQAAAGGVAAAIREPARWARVVGTELARAYRTIAPGGSDADTCSCRVRVPVLRAR